MFGEKIVYDKLANLLTCCDMQAPLFTRDGQLSLRILVDVTSIEIFANYGEFSMSNCYLPQEGSKPLRLLASEAGLVVKEMRINHIKSL